MDVRVVSLNVTTGGDSTQVAISSTSAQSAALTNPAPNAAGMVSVIVYASVDCFVRQGSNPTAVSDGTDQFLLGGQQYRLCGIIAGNKLAFKTTAASGTVNISPPSL